VLLTTRESRRWRRIGLAIFALLTALYWLAARRGFVHGGSPAGLAFGILALALILLLLLYGVRKRRYRSTLGRMEGWLQSHVYLGFVCLAVAFYHSGFRFHDRVAVAALVALAAVVVTGFVGAVLYTLVPRRLSEVEGDLEPAEIGQRLNQLAASMARLAAGKSAAFQRLGGALLDRADPGRLAGWRILFAGGRRRAAASATSGPAWEALLARVEAGEQDDLRRLLVLSRQHGELLQRLVRQSRYRNLLDAWLWLHLPLSLALLVLVVAHAVAALYFRGV
jgi:hypothetical protein